MPTVYRPTPSAPASQSETAGASTNQGIFNAPVRAPRASSIYDRVVTVLAVIGGLVLCVAAWYVSARFTVAALDSTGWLAPIGGWVWLVPVLVTALELRFSPNRRRGSASRAFWGVVLGFDVLTTAWGALPWVAQWSPDMVTSTIVATVLGFVFALAPEPAARAIVRENL